MTLLVVYVAAALGFSFLCSVLEAVLLSITPSYIAKLENERPDVGKRLAALKGNVDRPLAAILSLNTIAHTVGAAGAGAQAQALWGSEVLTAASVVLTLLILILSEIIPKTLGALYWRPLAPLAARTLGVMVLALYPLVVLSELITRGLSRGSAHAGKLDRGEIAALAEIGAKAGVLEEHESRMLSSLFRFGSVRARDVMTPRTVLCALHCDTTVGDALKVERVMRFSRIPIFRDSDDDVKGYVLKDALLLSAARDEHTRRVNDLLRKIVAVPDTIRLPLLLQRLLETQEHIALVIDEHGGTAGVVTLEDIVETLIGSEIVDEVDAVDDLRALARQRWLARAKDRGLSAEDLDAAKAEKSAASRR